MAPEELTDEQAQQSMENSEKPESIRLELSLQEAQALVDCLDIATKSGGLQVAKVTVPLVDKLMLAVQALKN